MDAITGPASPSEAGGGVLGLPYGWHHLHLHPTEVDVVAGEEEVPLAGEVAVENLSGNAHVLADVVDAGALIAILGKATGGGLEYGAARSLRLLGYQVDSVVGRGIDALAQLSLDLPQAQPFGLEGRDLFQ
jgi:hypothetical protein